ncbi:MAG TPA: hypothetical protein VJ698_00440 [Noviherbaspirillum sp.]|uniref:hypothetical protein n=1 Tax=Noviherbaspirillum sp. TaxID=1926288 RepID=UPI002B45FE43|nr:hypothetical protein [Noviherbaspirillum sp.]HJV83913.1 hypothetical protein [Noviherbaspirillum sp.]
MSLTSPNRNRTHSTGLEEKRRKESGDQHILPEDEPRQDPHRPHRVSREDMQKMRAPDQDEDDTAQP